MNAYDEYMKGIVKPMREELVQNGFTELTTAEEVEETMDKLEGTALVVINSVCGCAAGLARPAVREALQEAEHKPDHLLTVFAGQDKEATETMRDYFPEVPPSSPSIAFGKTGPWRTSSHANRLRILKWNRLKTIYRKCSTQVCQK